MADQLYIEDGYLETGYFERVVDVQIGTLVSNPETDNFTGVFAVSATVEIADTTGYYIPDYIEEGYYAVAVSEGQADLTASATVSCDATRIQQGDSELVVSNVLETQPGKLQDASADFGVLFTPSIAVFATKTGEILSIAQTSFAATASPIRDNDAALANIINLSLQGDRTRLADLAATASITLSATPTITRNFDAQFASQFSQTTLLVENFEAQLNSESALVASAISYQLRQSDRNINFDVFEEPYYDELLFSTNRKFGTHSLRLDGVDGEIAPEVGSKLLWNGSDYKIFAKGYTWTSSDAVTWTRTTNNLTTSFVRTDYLNNLYIAIGVSNKIAYSSDAVNWTEITVDIDNRTLATGDITYANGYWYVVTRRNTSNYNVTIYRNTALQSTGWTVVSSQSGSTIIDSRGFIRGVKRYGTSLVIATDHDPTLGASDRNIKLTKFTPANSFTTGATINLSSSSSEFSLDFAYDGTDYYVITRENSTYRLRKNNLSSPIASWNDYLVRIDYVGDRYITRRSTQNLNVTGTHISQTGFDVASTPTVNDVLSNPTVQNNKFFAINDMRYSGYRLVYTTTDDFITYSGVDIDTIEGVDFSRVEYADSSFDTWKTIDFWTKTNNLQFSNSFARPLSIGGVYIQTYESSNVRYLGINETNTFGVLSGVNYGNWTHIRLLRNGTTLKAYINGTSVGTKTISFADNTFKIMSGTNFGTYDVQVDEFLVSSEFLNPFADNSFTVPTQPYENQEDTLLLLHFDNAYDDDPTPARLTVDIDATLTAITNLSVTGGTTFDATTINVGEFTLGADANVIKGADANIASEVIVTGTGGYVKDFVPQLDSIATQISVINKIGNTLVDSVIESQIAIDAVKTAVSTSAMSSTATASTQAVLEANASADLNTLFDVYASAGPYLYDQSASASITSTLDVTPSRTRPFEAGADANTTLLATATKTVDVESSINCVSDTSATGLRIQTSNIELDSIATQLSAAAKIGDFLIDAHSNFTIAVDAVKRTGNVIAIDTNVDVAAEGVATRDTSANTNIVSAFSAEGTTNITAQAELSTTTSLSATGQTITDTVIEIDSAMSAVVVARGNLVGEILADIVSTLSTSADRTRSTSASVDATTSVSVVGSNLIDTSASATLQTALSADGNLIVLPQELTYVIPRETREYTILAETREFAIDRENREYTILGG